ncbi:MAG: hypothetical protein KGI26_04765 [Thaumarchaeota archaeon]|nr:hypothetical protein [Nitrososphaerota archaeon]
MSNSKVTMPRVKPHSIWCVICGDVVEIRARTRLEAIAMLDDPAVHNHSLLRVPTPLYVEPVRP